MIIYSFLIQLLMMEPSIRTRKLTTERFESFGRANPNNSRAARYSLLVAISGLTGKNGVSSSYNKKYLIYKLLFDFSDSL